MSAPENPPRKRSAAKPNQEIRAALEKAEIAVQAALDRAQVEERARLKAEVALTEAQAALATAQAKVEQERRTRVKLEQARAEIEGAPAASKATGVAAESVQMHLTTLRSGEAEQRISFVVRLTVDAQGQPRRTEVEHVQSGKKETFSALDVQRLAAFMNICISTPAIPESATDPAPPPVKAAAPKPGPPRLASSLDVSSIQVSRMGSPDMTTLTLTGGEAFMIQAHFQLRGPAAPACTAQGSTFEVKVYANNITSGKRSLLAAHKANLVKDVLDYTAYIEARGLPPGEYHLVTVVTIREPIGMLGYHEGPIVEVAGTQSSVSLDISPAAALPH
jgi:hypothetical protein